MHTEKPEYTGAMNELLQHA